MGFYGIATAVTGDKSNPRFHCNTFHLDPKKVKAISKQREDDLKIGPYKQKRILSDVEFSDPVRELSFDAPIDPSNITATAKRFLELVSQTVKLQKEDSETSEFKVPIIIGQDGRNGINYYPRQALRKTFIESDPQKVRELLPDISIHFGSFSIPRIHESGSVPRFSLGLDENLALYFERILKHHPTSEEVKPILEFLKEKARDAAVMTGSSFIMNDPKNDFRFQIMYFDDLGPHPDFQFLAWHPDIEREYIDMRRFMNLVHHKQVIGKYDQAHFHFEYKHDKSKFFEAVLKTILLDQLANHEDGSGYIDERHSEAFKRIIGREIKEITAS